MEVNGVVTVKERYGDNPKRVAPLTAERSSADIPPRETEIRIMKLRGSPFALALVFSVAGVSLVRADCAKLQALAQQHAYDMARRNSLDHAGFMQHRGPAGAAAENVAVGCDTEACARRMWMQSPAHRANMMLGGCQAVASAVSASGRRYWAMEIGGRGGGGGGRGGRGGDGIPGRDFSIDGANAP